MISDEKVTAILKEIPCRYLIYGSGGFVHKIITQIKKFSLPEPDFIFDNSPSCTEIQGITVVDANKVCILHNNIEVVLGSPQYVDIMKERVLNFEHQGNILFIDFNQKIEQNSLYRIEYIAETGFIFCDGRHDDTLDRVEVNIDMQPLGSATLGFPDFKQNGTNGWKIESYIDNSNQTQDRCISIDFYQKSNIIRKITHLIPASKNDNYYLHSTRPPVVDSKNIIFLEHPNLGNSEDKNILTKSMLSQISEYINIYGYELILVNFNFFRRAIPDLPFKQISLPNIETSAEFLDNFQSSPQYCEFQKYIEDAIENTINQDKLNYNKNISNKNSLYSSYLQRAAQFDQLIREHKPKLFMAWGEYNFRSPLLRKISSFYKVPSIMYHEGFLPETLQIDDIGEFANSFPYRCNEKFQKLSVNRFDLENANNIAKYYLTKNSRNKQSSLTPATINKLDTIKSNRKKIILLAGCNDWLTGLYPTEQNDREAKFTNFINSNDVFHELIRVCNNNNWHIIFKPHPHYSASNQMKKILDRYNDLTNITITYTGNIHQLIDYSDVVVTLMSTAVYEAMLRDVPVVLLSAHPFSGKGIAYECNSDICLDDVLSNALNKSDWESRKNSWLSFIARMSKYYLFPASEQMEGLMNKSIDHAARFLLKRATKISNN